MLKKILLGCALSVGALVLGFNWFLNTVRDDYSREELAMSLPEDLSYLRDALPPTRGKILAVVTSTSEFFEGKKTGFELTELARAYYVFQANGFDVDIASPAGGIPPMVIDDEDMAEFDYAFLNDPKAQEKVNNSILVDLVDPEDYVGLYFVGGKGAMFDFPDNTAIQSLIRKHYESGKVIGAVCHGPAALVNVELSSGKSLLAEKSISAFTNEEELFLIPEARAVFPFLLQDAIENKGAVFKTGPAYLRNIAVSGNIVTGQNPWSVWSLAEVMVSQLGYTPMHREASAEENSIDILLVYHHQGFDAAHDLVYAIDTEGKAVKRLLLGMHGIVAAMQGDLTKAVDLVRLAHYAKTLSHRAKTRQVAYYRF